MPHRYTSMARRARVLIVIFAAFAALIAVAAAKPTMAQNHQSTAQNHRSTQGKNSDVQLTIAADHVNALGLSHYRASFGGVRVTPSGKLIVYAVRNQSASFLKAISDFLARPANTAVDYSVVTVRHSWAQLLAEENQIARDWKQLTGRGVLISEMWPDPATNKILVTLRYSGSRAVTVLQNRFGVQWVTVNRVAHNVYSKPMGRFDDSAPFAGGDGIWFNSPTPPSQGFDCTSGFGIAYTKSDGTHTNGFVTAAHCNSNVGDAVWTNHDAPVKMGGVSFRHGPCTGNSDTEIFQASAIGDVGV